MWQFFKHSVGTVYCFLSSIFHVCVCTFQWLFTAEGGKSARPSQQVEPSSVMFAVSSESEQANSHWLILHLTYCKTLIFHCPKFWDFIYEIIIIFIFLHLYFHGGLVIGQGKFTTCNDNNKLNFCIVCTIVTSEAPYRLVSLFASFSFTLLFTLWKLQNKMGH